MVARIRDFHTREIVGYHKTYISEHGFKAPKENGDGPRLRETLVTNAGFILLFTGANPRLLCVGEGIETTLSLLRLPERRGVSAISLVCSGELCKAYYPGAGRRNLHSCRHRA